MDIPVYLFTGLLDSGKTTFIKEVINEESFLEPGATAMLLTEQGEVEYDEEFLIKHNIAVEVIEDKDEMKPLLWKRMEMMNKPKQILIEYNGMWELDDLFNSGTPENWFLAGVYSTVNGETIEMYSQNMRKMFMEPLRTSDLIIINRCDETIDRQKYRRSFKALNPQVQVGFERPDGTMYPNQQEELPFDVNADRIVIDDMDYGLWYIDAMDAPGRYMYKELEFTVKYCASNSRDIKYFVPGRHVMTCCEDDIQFLGYVCSFEKETGFQHGDWVRVVVSFDFGPCDVYGPGEEGPILTLIDIKPGQKPEQELVSFT